MSKCNPKRVAKLARNSTDARKYCPEKDAFEVDCDYVQQSAFVTILMVAGLVFVAGCLVWCIKVYRTPVMSYSQPQMMIAFCCGGIMCLLYPLLFTAGEAHGYHVYDGTNCANDGHFASIWHPLCQDVARVDDRE